MTDIYFVEDEPDIACAVKEYLEQKGFGVRTGNTIAQAKKDLLWRVPGLVLLDWNMPDGGGDALCRWIRGNWMDLPIIFLTVRGEARDMVSGFWHGADDYVVKPFVFEVLYARILALLRRSACASEPYLSCDGICLDQNRRAVWVYSGVPGENIAGENIVEENIAGENMVEEDIAEENMVEEDIAEKMIVKENRREENGKEKNIIEKNVKEIALSAAEYQLLCYLMQHKGRTITRENILEQVWDVHGSYVNDNTLTVTMKRLRDKLGQPACIKTVRSVGYRMEDTR